MIETIYKKFYWIYWYEIMYEIYCQKVLHSVSISDITKHKNVPDKSNFTSTLSFLNIYSHPLANVIGIFLRTSR